MLWQPLVFAFRRAPHLIACCMRLHNFCIDKLQRRAEPPSNPGDSCLRVQRLQICCRPCFDRDGIPVEMLSNHAPPLCSVVENVSRRDFNVAAIKERGLLRPAL